MSDQHDSTQTSGREHDDSGILPRTIDEPAGDSGATYVPGGARRARKRRGRGLSGCLAVLVALGIVAGLLYVGVTAGLDRLRDQFGDPEDYPGPGRGNVSFEVAQGDSVAQMGRNLKEAGVVASVDAFTDAASANPGASSIQVGFYPLKKEMPAADVVDVLVDPSNIVTQTVTVPEGLRVVDIVDVLAKGTDFPAAAFEKALDNPAKIGLPEYAEGNAEGYLFPATYAFAPTAKPVDMLRQMVARWQQAAEDADLEGAAAALDLTPHELMTVASLVEAEGRGDDMPKIARAIYNRLSPDNTETNGLLQIDATVNYALGRNLGVAISEEDLQVDSPYNTRLYPGLPPGPIEAPGDAAIRAAAKPADGPWLYWITVNLKTGETKFAETLDEFNRYKAEYLEYCETSDAC
ncbi:endolytic transglycosylase MltG [Nocardioides dongkuii]|uniref:endolytic transglycosylase MltG n=1 Tax=Nocardioides dongkuii TaxID=2760089 RepID=UPI001878EAFF|nr:endolytic transglycosylase MltG [Nocardioides dongkuii]